MFSPLPYIILFSSTLIMGTILTISSSNWLMIWMGLELNLLSFIPMMVAPTLNQESEASMKYFMAQAPASMMLVFSLLIYFFPNESIFSNDIITLIMILSLLMKLGMAPCHWWFPLVASKLSWNMNLVLMTWQKLAPLLIILSITKNMNNPVLLLAITMGALIGGITGLNQTNIRPLLAFSSISHMSWILAANLISFTTSLTYLLTYLLMTTSIILMIKLNFTNSLKSLTSWQNSNPSTTIPISILLMSMSGLPPLLGFIPKMLTFELMMQHNLMALMMVLITSALLNLCFYMNIAFNMFCHPFSTKKSFQTTPLNMTLSIMSTTPIFILPISMYAMTIFNKP